MKKITLLFVTLGLLGCSDQNADRRFSQFEQVLGSPSLLSTGSDTSLASQAHRPLPTKNELKINDDKVKLGAQLYHDGRLSKDGSLSCASCHVINHGGVDNLPVSVGVGGAKGGINAPTVLNSGFNFRQFWDGRASTLQEQAKGPPENPIEMAHQWPAIVVSLQQDAKYQNEFSRLYYDGITVDNIVDAIAEFEKTLVTYDSPYDRYLKGEQTALSPAAINGLHLFKEYGCISCHQGINVGGNLYHKMGAMVAYFDETHKPTATDQGLANRTNRIEDQNVFKVPSLRNVALTAPYFHNAAAKTLPEAIRIMSANQLGRVMPDNEIQDIAAFLESLTGITPANSN